MSKLKEILTQSVKATARVSIDTEATRTAPLLPEIPDEPTTAVNYNDVAPQKGIPVLRRLDREEWVTFNRATAITVQLWKRHKKGTEFDTEFFYFAKDVREPVAHLLRSFTILVYYSWDRDRHNLFLTAHAERGDNKWGDSMLVLLGKSPEWHAASKVNIQAGDGAYDIRQLDLTTPPPPWPLESTGALLAAALTPKFYVATKDHPVFAQIEMGRPIQ